MTSKPLTFGELEIGDSFIDFPVDGDDSGHGGFRKGSYVFKKIKPILSGAFKLKMNTERVTDKGLSSFPDSMQVYKVLL